MLSQRLCGDKDILIHIVIAFDVNPLRRHTQRDWQCVTFKKKPLVFDKMFNNNKCKVTKIM